MRVALFTDTYAPQVNGVARTLARLVTHLQSKGVRVALVTPCVEDEVAREADLQIPVQSMSAPLYPELQLARPTDRATGRRLAAFAPDIVHVATECTIGWSGRRWAARTGVPLVTSFHTNFPDYLPGYGLGILQGPLWRYLRLFHEAAAVTLCPSRATRRALRARGFHDRIRVWSRGVDPCLYKPERRSDTVRARLAPGADRILLYVGRLASEKRIHLLLEAFPRIRAGVGPRTALARSALTLLRDDPLRTEIAAACRATALERGWPRILDGVLSTYVDTIDAAARLPTAARAA